MVMMMVMTTIILVLVCGRWTEFFSVGLRIGLCQSLEPCAIGLAGGI